MLWGYCAIHIIRVQEVERLPALSNLLQTIKNKQINKRHAQPNQRAYNMKNYEQQANDFLQKTNTTISLEYLKNDFHFINDESTRDIYRVKIKRGGRSITFEFGQSIINSAYYKDKRVKDRTYSLNGKARTGGFSILDVEKYKNGGMD